jgi:esterase/lipase
VGLGLAAGMVVVVAGALAMAPASLVNQAQAPSISGKLDEWLALRERDEASKTPLIEGTEKRIRWYRDQRGTVTRLAIVYFHGFSATRQEIAPVAEVVADALGANLFETRLSGHGLQVNPLADVSAEDWLDDAAEALTIGQQLGESVIVMGTSTGATLALAMVHHASFERVSSLILLSPNIALRDTNSELLTWPGGPQLAYMVAGDTRSWTPNNELQARYWTTSYPTDALVEMMRLVKFVRNQLPMTIPQSLLVFYSPDDSVVDPAAITSAFEQIHSSRQQLIPITGSGDSSNHVIAGDILSPQNNKVVTEAIVRFIRNGAD